MKDTQKTIEEYQKQIDNFRNKDGLFEQISTLLTTHLYVEHFINYIIENHFKLKKKIFDDNRSYSFSIKLDFVYEKGFIPEWLYFNIRKLNTIRNMFSHNLHFDILKMDLTFKLPDDENEVEIIDLKKGFDKRKKNYNRNMLIIMHIPSITLLLLEAHIRRNGINWKR
jgi:hypothetical protein